MQILKNKFIVPLVFLLYFLIQFILVLRVGFTWDEPSILFIGKRNYDFWISGNWQYGPDYRPIAKSTDGPLRMVYGAKYYPPLLPTVAVTLHELFYTKLHLLPSVPAYHFAGLLVSFIGIIVLYALLKELGFGKWLSLGVSLLYGLYPSIAGQMRNDLKDVPLAAAVIVLVYLFIKLLHSYPKNISYFWTFCMGISLGLAILMKPTAALMVLIIIAYCLVSLVFPKGRRQLPPIPMILTQVLLIGILALVIVVFLWPRVWSNPVEQLLEAFNFLKTTGLMITVPYFGTIYRAGMGVPWHYPFGVLLVQTPPPLLVFFLTGIVGIFWNVKKTKNPLPLFFLLWVGIALFRFSLPGFLIYAKVRQLMDALPGLFIIGIYGIDFIGTIVHTYIPIRKSHVILALCGIALAHELFILVQFAPYEPSYFNFIVGGTKNVAEKQLFDSEYWGSSVREAMEYVDKAATKPVTVYTCTMAHLAKYFNTDKVTTVITAERADYFLIPNSKSYFGDIFTELEGNGKIVYTVRRAGTDLFYVYKSYGGLFPQCGSESEDI
jgi:hypothetical protein